MAYNEEKFTATIEINNSRAKEKVAELEKDVKRAREELIRLKQKDSGATKEQIKLAQEHLKHTTKTLTQERKLVKGLDDALKSLAGKTYNDLRNEVKQLNALMRNGSVTKGTEAWKQLAERIKAAKKEMREYTEATRETESIGKRVVNFLNTNWGALTQILGSVTGLSVTVRKAVQAYAQMEEEMANVRKYTGMTDEQVRDLNEDLKKMDTRTSREELNKLAGEAGRLGIQGKEAIEDFVDAADKIDVALGDDLGENAVRDIGKLAQVFSDGKTGLRESMLATGSAVNELAQSSSASAGYIVDFTARIAGAAKQIGMTQAQQMGFASTLDQNMQHLETASTALSQLITKIYQDPAKFAKLAGQDVKEFTDLLATDANAAILQFLESMKARGGFDRLAPMFTEMGLSGTRAVAVLSTLAENIGDIRVQQETAAKAFREGTSVLDEFDRMNETVQAGIDKAKKAFHEVFVELGYNLQPVVKYTISFTGLLVKALLVLVNVGKQYRTTIIAATAALVAWNAAAVKALIVNTLTKALKACRVAVTALNAALNKNPWGIVATGIALVVGFLADYAVNTRKAREETARHTEEARKAAEAQKRIEAEQKNVSRSTADMSAKYKALQAQWKALSSESEKNRWIRKNQEAFTELGLAVKSVNDAEKVLVKDAAKVAKALELTAKATAYGEMYQDEVRKQVEFDKKHGGKVTSRKVHVGDEARSLSEDERETLRQRIQKKSGKYNIVLPGSHRLDAEEVDIITEMRRNAARKAYREEKKSIDDSAGYYLKKLTEIQKELATAEGNLTPALPTASEPKGGKTGGGTQTDPRKEQEQQLQEMFNRESLLRKQAYAEDMRDAELTDEEKLQAEKDFTEDMYQLTQTLYAKKRDLYEKDSAEWVAIEDKRLEAQTAHDKQAAKERVKALEDAQKAAEKERLEAAKQVQDMVTEFAPVDNGDELENLRRHIGAQEAMLEDFHERGLISEEQYQQGLEAIRNAHEQLQEEQTKRQIEKTREAVEFALQQVSGIVGTISSYVSASYNAQTAQVTARYDAEIKAAEKAGKDTTKLEERKQKELNKIKLEQIEAETEAQKAEALINIALGVTKAIAEYVWPYNAIVAGITTAMGMVQMATIEKQAEAQKAAIGYYSGGFTGGSNYRREAGVVHEGEFVANHEAVNNPDLAPVLSLIDEAQRSNRVASLRAEDVTNVMGGPAAQVVAPVVNVQTDNTELRGTLEMMGDTITRLSDQIDEGIETNISIQELEKKRKRYNQLTGA